MEPNNDATVGTIYSRRDALALAAKAGIILTSGGIFTFVPAESQKPKANLIASPALTEGPFFVDEKLNRSNLLVGTTRESVVKGTPLSLELEILRLTDDKHVPFAGVQIDLWHCDAAGVYSDESNPMNHEDTAKQTWLRGYQITNSKGKVKFETIVPGWYPGRTAHIHFKVRTFSEKHQVTADFTSQLFFHEDDLKRIYANKPYSGQDVPANINKQDNIFAEPQMDGSLAGEHLTLQLAKADNGHAAKFTIVLTDKNLRVGTQRGRGAGGPGGPDGRFNAGWDQF